MYDCNDNFIAKDIKEVVEMAHAELFKLHLQLEQLTKKVETPFNFTFMILVTILLLKISKRW